MTAAAQTCMEIDATGLVQLLEHQQVLYRRLRFLADRQRALVMMEDHQPLLDLLSERQKLVDGLAALAGQMAPYRSGWAQLYRGMDESLKRRVTTLLEEVNASLAAILQSDGRDTAMIEARKQCVAQQLSSAGDGYRASAAYARTGSDGPAAATLAEG